MPSRLLRDYSETGLNMPINVVLIDDHKIVRDGLRVMLDRQMDIEVIGEASNGRDGIERARELSPDVVVMDISMKELNGIDATKRLRDQLPDVHVVALSMHSDARYIADMLAAGASAYVVKECAHEELTLAIRAVHSGERYISRALSAVVLEDYVNRMSGMDSSSDGRPIGRLSAREREVLQLVSEGLSTKEVASRLHLSAKTIETHRRQIMDKLDIHNVAGLVKLALREGLTTLD